MSEPSDRELDALVAEKVMGEPKPEPPPDCDNPIDDKRLGSAWIHTHYYSRGDLCEVEPRPFTSNISAAMEVVEKMGEQNWEVSIDNLGITDWRVRFENDGILRECEADPLPRAICLAALKACEVYTEMVEK